jgi:predicted transposase YdaD
MGLRVRWRVSRRALSAAVARGFKGAAGCFLALCRPACAAPDDVLGCRRRRFGVEEPAMAPPPPTPHDKLFRALLDDPERARGLLRDHLPADIVAELADAPPVPLEGTFVDEALQGSQSDRLFQVALRDGREAYVYALLEHKSTPDPRTPIQLLTYMARIWDRHVAEMPADANHLPAIIPLVIYHGQRPWTVPLSVLDAVDAPDAVRERMTGLGYILRDLGPIADADLARDQALRAGLAALKYAFDKGVAPEVLVFLLAALPDESLLEKQVVEYLVRVYDMSEERFGTVLDQAKPHRREELMGTVAEEWLKRGKAEGLAEGKAEGKAEAVLSVLGGRFGRIDAELRARIWAAEPEALDAMLKRAGTVAHPEEVFGNTPRH